jgi:hypothetical protein
MRGDGLKSLLGCLDHESRARIHRSRIIDEPAWRGGVRLDRVGISAGPELALP